MLHLELNRIMSHLVWLGTSALDLGAISMFWYCFRDRESILDLFEMSTGQRMHPRYFQVGGVIEDIPAEFPAKVRAFAEQMPDRVDQYLALLAKNEIVLHRLRGVAPVDSETLLALGVTSTAPGRSSWSSCRRGRWPNAFAPRGRGSGFFTPTGFGTTLADGKETRRIDGRDYVLEEGLTADFALVKAYRADRLGNLVYRKTARNFGPLMAAAARHRRAGLRDRRRRPARSGKGRDTGYFRATRRRDRRHPTIVSGSGAAA